MSAPFFPVHMLSVYIRQHGPAANRQLDTGTAKHSSSLLAMHPHEFTSPFLHEPTFKPAPTTALFLVAFHHVQVAKRPSAGLQFDRWTPNLRVIRYKLLGFHTILAAIGFFYYVTHEYSKDMYALWFLMLSTMGPWAYAASLVYFVVVDGYQTETSKKEDMYHNLGRVVARQGTAVPIPAWR